MELMLIMAIVACTGSMEPAFTCNQTVLLNPEFELEHGEVYVYNNTEKLIMHRLVYYNRFDAYFKADITSYLEKVPRNQILYIVEN